MTVRSTSSGTHWTSAVPSVATSKVSVAAAARAPSSALRQLTVTPTTRTMVNASTNSTAEAKNAAVATTHCMEMLLRLAAVFERSNFLSLLRWSRDGLSNLTFQIAYL